MTKRFVTLLLALALLLTATACAQYGDWLTVVNCDEWVSLREAPDKKSSRVAKVPLGAEVMDTGEFQDDFTYVFYGDLYGYIQTKYLAPSDSVEPEENGGGWMGDMMVVGVDEWVSLRSAPNKDASRLKKVPLGAIVTDCAWYTADYIYGCYNGTYGYILGKYLHVDDGSIVTTPSGYEVGDMVVVNCDSWVSLRQKPNSASDRLKKVPLGAMVTNCQFYNSDFIYCRYQGSWGFIQSQYLAFGEGGIADDGKGADEVKTPSTKPAPAPVVPAPAPATTDPVPAAPEGDGAPITRQRTVMMEGEPYEFTETLYQSKMGFSIWYPADGFEVNDESYESELPSFLLETLGDDDGLSVSIEFLTPDITGYDETFVTTAPTEWGLSDLSVVKHDETDVGAELIWRGGSAGSRVQTFYMVTDGDHQVQVLATMDEEMVEGWGEYVLYIVKSISFE